MWLEHWRWPKARQVDAAAIARTIAVLLAQRGIALSPVAIKDDDDRVEGALVEMIEEYTHIYVGAGDLRLTMVAMGDRKDTGGYIGFSLEDHPAAWEPAYLLFAAIAKALGGEIEDMVTEDWEPDRLHDELCDAVDNAATEVLDDPDPSTAVVLGPAPLDAFDCTTKTDDAGLFVEVTGAGERIAVRLACDPDELGAKHLAKLATALRDDIEPIVLEHAFCHRANLAPAADPQRANKIVLEVLQGGRITDAVVVDSLDGLRRHAGKRAVTVTQYFSSGAPFWQAALREDHDLDDLEELVDLHDHRTWQWTP
jgi:hypothetical protein